MIDQINSYLDILDEVLEYIPKNEKVLLEKLIESSYSLVDSSQIMIQLQVIDYFVCYMFSQKYINFSLFLKIGKSLEGIIYGLKGDISFE
ncbi:MAG: hypothetical protein ACI4P7_00880 [Bacilli bacterium]